MESVDVKLCSFNDMRFQLSVGPETFKTTILSTRSVITKPAYYAIRYVLLRLRYLGHIGNRNK